MKNKKLSEVIARGSVSWTPETAAKANELAGYRVVEYSIGFPEGYFKLTERGTQLLSCLEI